MSVLPPTATFEEVVQDCFLALSGRGLMLSALDVQLLSAWAEHNVPVEVVIRGMQRARERVLFDARRETNPMRSLRSCRRDVEVEIKRHRSFAVGEGQPTSEVKPSRKLDKALKKLLAARPELTLAVARGRKAIRPEADPGRQDATILYSLFRSLAFTQRVALTREARTLTEEAPALSFRARQISRRFHRLAVIRRALALPPFW
jgi:hypothetical protein